MKDPGHPVRVKNLLNEKWAEAKFPRKTKSKDYFISNKGRVKSVDRTTKEERLIKTSQDKMGYMRATIKLEGGHHALYVHKQVALHFSHPKSPDHKYVIHKDLNRKNNMPSNVIWVNKEKWNAYKNERRKKYGFKATGPGGYQKLSSGEVAIIKKMLLSGKTRKKMIAKRFGVSHTQINRIEKGENWAHIKPAK